MCEKNLSGEECADVHRLMRYTDEVDQIVDDDIENEVASLGVTSVARMDVISFSTCERIVSQPLKPIIEAHQVGFKLC